MSVCPSCGKAVSAEQAFCPACGASAGEVSSLPTSAKVPTPPLDTPSISSPSGPPVGGRFMPGAVIAGRYRIIGLVGRGGMGEVYRADDLKLGQPVALKFLPQKLADDDDSRERFLDEVRTARKVSHPNVCRVWDIGETDGQQFISMEFVDGEDLASLLRRIGRAPKEKAAQIARQLCAGLAAAHEEGVLHRDLKPANVMIDGRGRVRLTDFGIASLAGQMRGDDRAGTPMYMAPELLAGGSASMQSDVYALGLVLYELFTGKRAYKADTRKELMQLQSATPPARPASLVDGMDPAVERIILACLSNDPRSRPRTALAVAAALPGGDPLAAALAAGETPAPELVAAAEIEGALSPPVAAACLAAVGVGLALLIAFAPYWQIVRMSALEMSGDALALRARDIMATAGSEEPSADSLDGFWAHDPYVDFIIGQDEGPTLYERLPVERPGAFRYWYRESPVALVALDRAARAGFLDPPMQTPGSARVVLDAQGNLLDLWIVPRRAWNDDPRQDVVWVALFAAAGLDAGAFEPVTAEWNRSINTDTRLAWRGTYPDSRGLLVTVEAGAFAGRAVHFRVVFPWAATEVATSDAATELDVAAAIGAFWTVSALVAAALIARRNLRLGRGDRRGAFRLAVLASGLFFAAWLTGAHHVAAADEIELLLGAISRQLFWGCLVWVCYMAIEPAYRRLWPEQLVSWVRLLDGRIRDPLVGRDVLLGVVWGVTGMTAIALWYRAVALSGRSESPPQPMFGPDNTLGVAPVQGIGELLSAASEIVPVAMIEVLFVCVLLVALRLILRHTIAAVVAFGSLVGLEALNNHQASLAALITILAFSLSLALLFRFGVLFWSIFTFVYFLLLRFPLTHLVNSWYIGNTVFVVLLLGGLAVYGFSTSLAGRPVLADEEDLAARVA